MSSGTCGAKLSTRGWVGGGAGGRLVARQPGNDGPGRHPLRNTYTSTWTDHCAGCLCLPRRDRGSGRHRVVRRQRRVHTGRWHRDHRHRLVQRVHHPPHRVGRRQLPDCRQHPHDDKPQHGWWRRWHLCVWQDQLCLPAVAAASARTAAAALAAAALALAAAAPPRRRRPLRRLVRCRPPPPSPPRPPPATRTLPSPTAAAPT